MRKSIILWLFATILFVACEKSAILSTNIDSLHFGEYGGSQTIVITANKVWTANIDQSWCKVSPSFGDGATAYSSPITITCERNTWFSKRSCILRIESDDKGSIINIEQDAADYIIQFRDNNFKQYCLENFDVNGDGGLSVSEAKKIYTVNVTTERIRSLEGIEYMVELRTLTCAGPQNDEGNLMSIDLSKNPELKFLNCENNKLIELDLSNNKKLESIHCSHNHLLEKLTIGATTSLKGIYCDDCNISSSLYASAFPNLMSLDIRKNSISQVYTEGCKELVLLWCDENEITYLDVSKNNALAQLHCWKNKLSYLDVSANYELNDLVCSRNNISTLVLGNNNKLQEISCGYNPIRKISLEGCSSLEELNCQETYLTKLDVSNNPQLSRLNCWYNQYLKEIWLKRGQYIESFSYDTDTATIYYY